MYVMSTSYIKLWYTEICSNNVPLEKNILKTQVGIRSLTLTFKTKAPFTVMYFEPLAILYISLHLCAEFQEVEAIRRTTLSITAMR